MFGKKSYENVEIYILNDKNVVIRIFHIFFNQKNIFIRKISDTVFLIKILAGASVQKNGYLQSVS